MKFGGKALEQKAKQVALDAVKKRVEGIRCPTHGTAAKVVARTSGSKFTWDVSGCCDELVAKVKASLK